jgi:carbamoyltransferase
MSIIVSCSRGHNASTTLMVDGEIIFYVEEERLSRWKHDGSPLLGLLKVFEYVDHIDHLVICHTHRNGPELDWTGEDLYHGWIRKLSRKSFTYKTHFIDTKHHEMHGACAFLNSGFESAACVIADGAGSFLQTDACPGIIYEFETIFKAKYPLEFTAVYKHLGSKESIGIIKLDDDEKYLLTEYPGLTKTYEAVTEYCGFSSIDAGKTMGLSPYGRENSELPELFRNGWANREVFVPNYPNGSKINTERYKILSEDIKSHVKGEYTQIQKDLAFLVQKETETRMIELIRKAHEETGETNIVVCGGYGLNCVANYKYWKEFPDLNIYCEPISHDGGTSIGGAKYVHAEITEMDEPFKKQTSIYYGPKYDPESYNDFIEDYEVTDTSYNEIAKMIRDGNIVTIFQGSSEGGPRALGNRSILFDPTIVDGKDIVNKVKRREFFRPFACSILKEKVNEWFDLAGREESPHMMYAVDCLPGVEEKIPSVIHVDGTCRIQTVTKEQNEHYYNLISAFEKLSEVPILFNTSFNLGGDPLVETIVDAINTLQQSDIEYMYLPEIQKLVKIPNNDEF